MKRLAVAAVVSAAAVLVGTAGAAQSLPSTGKVVRGKLQTDGVLTVGQPETISVRKMSPKVKLMVGVAPRNDGTLCSAILLCSSEQILPAPGTSFRTSGKGRAILTFVVPSNYEVFNLRHLLRGPQQHSFVNGQGIEVSAFALKRRHRRLDITLAGSSAVIEVPPTG